MVATAISFGLLTIRFMRRFRTSHCAFPWHIYMLFLLHRAFWQLPALLGIAVSGLWCYTSPLPKPNLRLVRLSTMMLHLSYSLVRARPDTCLSSLTSMALLGSLLRLALVLVVMLPLWTLVESCLPTSWAAGPFVLLLLLIHVSRDLLPLGLFLSVAVPAKTLCFALRTYRCLFLLLG